MSTEEQKAKVRRAIDEGFHKGNLNAFDEILTAGVIIHQPPQPDTKGPEAYKQMVADIRKGFSEVKFTIDDFIREGETDAIRYTIQGIHSGQLPNLPIPPTGKRVTITGLIMVRTVNGKAVEQWVYQDMIGLMQSLGVAPPMGPGGK